MKKTAAWGIVVAFAAAGIVGIACGGGGGESAPANAGSAPAASSAAPAESAAPAASSAAAAPTPPPALVIAAMKLTMPKQKDAIELKDDGSVEVKKKNVLKFAGNELRDPDGKALASVAADGTVTFEGAEKKAKFDDKDDLVLPDGARMTIGDDGVVKLLDHAGKPDKDSGKLKFVGFKPTARRAAAVLVVAAMMVHKESEAPPTVASTTAAAAPKKK